MLHEVKTYSSGKMMYWERYDTAQKAYKAYTEIVENLTRNLPKGRSTIVTRWSDGDLMNETTVSGIK